MISPFVYFVTYSNGKAVDQNAVAPTCKMSGTLIIYLYFLFTLLTPPEMKLAVPNDIFSLILLRVLIDNCDIINK